MRKLFAISLKIAIAALILFIVPSGHAQAAQAVLTWKASSNSTPTTPGTVSVYRASGTCPASGIGTLTYTLLTAAAPAAGPYTDTTMTPGTWCYYVTATISGLTSAPSTTAQNQVTPLPPTGLTITVTIPSASAISITTKPN